MAQSAPICCTGQLCRAFEHWTGQDACRGRMTRIAAHYCAVFEQVVSSAPSRPVERPIARLGTLGIWHRHTARTRSWRQCSPRCPGSHWHTGAFSPSTHGHTFDRTVTTRTTGPRWRSVVCQRPMIRRLRAVDASESGSYRNRKWQVVFGGTLFTTTFLRYKYFDSWCIL